MASPFPGMNPYLEQDDVWQDFHSRFITHMAGLLGEQLQPAYIVKIEVQLMVHELPADERRLAGRADVAVGKPIRAMPLPETALDAAGSRGQVAQLADAPVYGIQADSTAIDVERHPYVEIRDRLNREVVTVIELLSPSNKYAGPDRDQYLAKRRRILYGPSHLVEIDLLRGGPRLPWGGLPPCDYGVAVSRSQQWPRVGLWPITLRQSLPAVPVPVREPHPDARLDLHLLLQNVYDSAGYAHYIYNGTPQPALPPEDAAWARQFLPHT